MARFRSSRKSRRVIRAPGITPNLSISSLPRSSVIGMEKRLPSVRRSLSTTLPIVSRNLAVGITNRTRYSRARSRNLIITIVSTNRSAGSSRISGGGTKLTPPPRAKRTFKRRETTAEDQFEIAELPLCEDNRREDLCLCAELVVSGGISCDEISVGASVNICVKSGARSGLT